MKVRIYYHDTDCGGVVYYANYLKYLEQGRTEFLQEKGVSIGGLAGEGVLFVVARQEIDYKAPAHYGDTLEIATLLEDLSQVKMVLACEIKNQDGKTICLARTILVCVGKDLKPRALPQDVRKALE
ncbi:MAG: thioesterase family protein [Candidatus Omnitrophota bacterium]